MTQVKNGRNAALAAALTAALSLCGADPARAWGPVGHKAVAMIAQAQLSPRALAMVRQLLGKSADGREIDLHEIANCADGFSYGGVRGCAGAFEMVGEPGPSKPWHFIDIPLSAERADDAYCPGGKDCVSAQIQENVKTLRDPRASRSQKQTALAFLVHFVGDIHQPLHCADDADRGGNAKAVDVVFQKPLNLHSVWDDALERPADVFWRLPQETLTAQAERLVPAVRGQRIEDAQAAACLAQADPADVSVAAMEAESWCIAKRVIYPQYALDGGRIANASFDDIGDAYRRRMQPIAFRRIELAGLRLAKLIELAAAPLDRAERETSALRRDTGALAPKLRALDPGFGAR